MQRDECTTMSRSTAVVAPTATRRPQVPHTVRLPQRCIAHVSCAAAYPYMCSMSPVVWVVLQRQDRCIRRCPVEAPWPPKLDIETLISAGISLNWCTCCAHCMHILLKRKYFHYTVVMWGCTFRY